MHKCTKKIHHLRNYIQLPQKIFQGVDIIDISNFVIMWKYLEKMNRITLCDSVTTNSEKTLLKCFF
jgi:hypothetical protein